MAEKLTPGQAEILINIIRKFMQEVVQPIDVEFVANTTLVGIIKHKVSAFSTRDK